MYHIYNKKGQYEYTVYDLSNEDKEKLKETHFILDTLIEFPKLEGNEIVSMSEEEIQEFKYKQYQKQEYNLAYNEIIQENKIVVVDLKEYEYIQEGILKFNYDKKKEDLLAKSKTLEDIEKEKPFEFKGYIQPNRELEDQTSLLKVINGLMMRKQTKFDFWKMKDKEGHEHYVSLTLQEMMSLGEQMTEQTTKAMMKWSKIREQIKSLSNEELKEYELGE